MKKLTIPLAVLAAVSLAACVGIPETRIVGSQDSIFVASVGTLPAGGTVHTGLGRVGHPMSSTTVVDGSATQVVTLSMKDGTKQTLVVRGSQLRMAELVMVESDRIRHIEK